MVVAIVVVTLLAVGLSVLVVVGLYISGRTTVTGGSTATPTPQASSQDEWLAAVCRPGSFINGGHVLHNADGSAQCISLKGNPILIGQYSSEYMAHNDVAILHAASSAIVATGDRYELFVAPVDRSGASLQPLARFGFTITASQ